MFGSPALDPRLRRGVLLAGQPYDEERFYQERDSRTQGSTPFARASVPVGVALSAEAADSAAGQTAFVWAASMLRRMGRPFAAVRLLAPSHVRQQRARVALHRHVGLPTFEQVVQHELRGADPFAPFWWRDLDDAGALADVAFVLWIGGGPDDTPTSREADIHVRASGWVVRLDERAREAPATKGARIAPMPFEAAPAAAVLGAALAVAAVYRRVQESAELERQGMAPEALPSLSGGLGEDVRASSAISPLWYSADTGAATTDAEAGHIWMARGSSAASAAPWAITAVPIPLAALVIVSAGGLGGNVAQILSASHVQIGRALVVDPDSVDLSNLNRLIGVGIQQVGAAKVIAAGQVLAARGIPVEAVQASYEAWVYHGEGPEARAVLDAPGTVVVVGADQVGTRLEVQADWPALVVNASTAGTAWKISWHPKGNGGCLGCVYAADGRSYSTTRGPQACAAGAAIVPGAPMPPVFAASYAFATVGAAAALAARTLRSVWESNRDVSTPASAFSQGQTDASAIDSALADGAAGLCEANALRPQFGRVATPLERRPGCPLLCSHPALNDFLTGAVDPAQGVAHK